MNVPRRIREAPVDLSVFPFRELVPRDFAANMEFRERLLAVKGAEARRNIWIMCKRDIVFWLGGFGWLIEPRVSTERTTVIPFIPYPFQEDFFAVMLECLDRGKPMCCVKTRGMGLTWMMAAIDVWLMQFHSNRSMGVMSRVEDLVDKTGNPDTIMGKMDVLMEKQPAWMRSSMETSKLHRKNLENGSVVDGSSTTANSFRGGRRFTLFVDEHAHIGDSEALHGALNQVSNCRVYGSTPNGTGNMFHKTSENPAWEQVRLHWTMHPIYAMGLEHDARGRPTSPWYRAQCAELGHKQLIAQELDMDFLASQFGFFEEEHLTAAARGIRQPVSKGTVEFDRETGEFRGFTVAESGECLLWVRLEGGQPPQDRTYTVGADVSAGTGTSNSVLYVSDDRTGEQVAEIATPYMEPDKFAALARAVCMWFKGMGMQAGLIWERNGGHGQHFTRKIMEMGVENPYSDETAGQRKEGHHTDQDKKYEGMSDLRGSVMSGRFVPRSADTVREFQRYVYVRKVGKLAVEVQGVDTESDPSGAGEAHGDRVTAAWLCCKYQRIRKMTVESGVAELRPGSLAWMMEQLEMQKKPERTFWRPRQGERGFTKAWAG